jgi:hypothetical protein
MIYGYTHISRLPHIPAALSTSVSRWLGGEGYQSGHAIRPHLKARAGQMPVIEDASFVTAALQVGLGGALVFITFVLFGSS